MQTKLSFQKIANSSWSLVAFPLTTSNWENNESIPAVVVAAPTATKPRCSSLRRGFHCATLRLQDESKSDKPPSSSSTSYHDHYQTQSDKQDTAAASQEDLTSDPAAEEASRPNTRSVSRKAGSEGKPLSSRRPAFWHQLPGFVVTEQLPFCVSVPAKLPGSGRRAGWGVRNGGAAPSSNPGCRPGVCPPTRLVAGSYCCRCWGRNWGM